METEQTPDGEVKEQPGEEISKEVPQSSKETKATSEKDDEWKRMMQSRTDKAEADAQKAKERLQRIEQEAEQQRLAERKRQIEALADEPEEQTKLRRRHELEDANRKLEEENLVLYEKVWKKYDQSIALADKYNLSPAEARELMKADTPKEMELQAKLLVKDLEKAETSKPETIIPDSGRSDAGTDSDEAFQKRWNAGDIPATKENLARINKIINK